MKPMKRLLCFLLLLSCATLLAGRNVSDCCVRDSLRYKGADRIHWVYVPDSLSADAPLLICLHGYGGRADRYGAQLVDLAEEKGFAVCFPQGLKDGRGKPCWKDCEPMMWAIWRNWSGRWCSATGSIPPTPS